MASQTQKEEGDVINQVEQSEEQFDTSNKFANDGSFMELVKKRLEEQRKASGDNNQPSDQNKPTNQSTSKLTDTGERDKIYQGVAGKRKSLLKGKELREKRKKRREEIEEQKAAAEGEPQSAAWKAYMQEVKAIQARSCTDGDGHKRPLVK